MCSFLEGCEYIVGFGEAEVWKGAPVPFYSAPAGWPHLEAMLESGLDVFASLWRHDATVGVIDIEYFNHRWKGKAITDPGHCMWAVRPVVEQFLWLFAHYGMPFLGIVTGQGVQLLFQVPFSDPVHDRLIALGGGNEESLQQQYDLDWDGKRHRRVPWAVSVASKGMFRCELKMSNDVMKGLQQRRDMGEDILPVVYSDILMGDPEWGLTGRGPEGVSIDLTCFGDPIHMRDHRAPFSTHQKQRADGRYMDVYWAPIKVSVPFWNLDHYDAIALKRMEEVQYGQTDFAWAASIADETVDCSIPTAAWAVNRVMDDIQAGALGAFFAHMDSQEHNYEWDWGHTYWAPEVLEGLPPCARVALEHPDPLLLTPTHLQRLVRILDAQGWHPKHIGGLLYSRYKNIGWGHYNPEKRANYWVEQYCGPIHDGTDDKRYMSCEEEQLRGSCPQPFCGWDLRRFA